MTTDTYILKALRLASPGSVSGVELAERLGIGRAAVGARIQELRSLGYEIEASPHRGYSLLGCPDLLHADDLLSRLAEPRIVGRDIQVFRQTTSTNDVVEKLARDGIKEGMVVFAESQSKGRGRMGRTWDSASHQGLWFSLLLRPAMRAAACTRLTILAATSIARAIHLQTGLVPEIKWPNDILLDGRKVAGILTELTGELDYVRHVIVGMGVNVNQGSAGFSHELKTVATSLRLQAGHPVARAELAARILTELDQDYRKMNQGCFHQIAEEWSRQCITLGRLVSVQIGNRRVHGCAEALDDEGVLLLRTDHGRLERITGGEVMLAKKS